MAAKGPSPASLVPTIDISPYLTDASSGAAAEVVQRVQSACMTSGFFSLVGHGISKELQQSILDACRLLFALPLEEKKALRSPILQNRGYELIGSQALQEGTLPDLKEGYYISKNVPSDHELARRHPQFLGENVFPDSIPDEKLKEPAERYYDEVFALSLKVLEVLAKGLPYGDDIFAEFVSGIPICACRFLHYPPQTSRDERQLGAGAHTDFGAITLLLQDDAGGLEILNRDTGEWIPVAPDPDAYVVNIGDMLALWTRGIYKSTVHRVVNKSGGNRYSVPFFFDGNADVELVPLDGGRPPGGRILTVEGHMLERFGTTYGRVTKHGGSAERGERG